MEWGVTGTIESTKVTLRHHDQPPKEHGMYEFKGIINSEGASVLDGCFEIESFVKLEIEESDMDEYPRASFAHILCYSPSQSYLRRLYSD